MPEYYYLSKFVSIIYRQTNRFYDRWLNTSKIGCGQYFFLLHISNAEGACAQDFTKNGYFDKGTIAKAIQKLEEKGLIRSVTDNADRRIRRLYTTEKALPIIEAILAARAHWHSVLTTGMTEAEIQSASHLLEKMSENSYQYLIQLEMNEHGKTKRTK